MDNTVLMITSSVVISLCIILSITFTVCCFWSPCPFYSMCRINYNYGDIVAFSKEDDDSTLPPDNCGKHNYTPLKVKLKHVENV